MLFLSRDQAALAALLPKLLGPAARKSALKAAGLPALSGPAGDLRMARDLARNRRLLHALTDALAVARSATAATDADAEIATEGTLGELHAALADEDSKRWAEVLEQASNWEERLPDCADPVAAASSPTAPKPASPAALKTSNRDRVRAAKATLQDARHEIARLEQEVSQLHQREEGSRENIADLQARLRDAELRAAEQKRRLVDAVTPEDREAALAARADESERRASVAEQKLQIVELERDDFRACLEDTERFLQVAEEEVPSFRDRPLLAVEQSLADQAEAAGCTFRVLVIGGGEPQRRHQDKFREYAEVMGFVGEWRMAEYISWHKEMKRLTADMRDRYDALVILHWNRTTFTRSAREICNQQGQRPCITCHYEGFTSLRETMQECLRQLLAAAERE